MTYLILLIIGLLGGTLAGLLGVGGGVIFTPVLFFIFDGRVDDPVSWTIGTSLLCTFAAAIGSTRKHLVMKNFYLKESLMVGGFGLAGTVIGKMITLSDWYTKTEFTVVFSSILLFTSYKFFRVNNQPDSAKFVSDPVSEPMLRVLQTLMIGLGAGLIATLAGVGGGIIMVPLMTLLFGLSFPKSISISSFAILMISFFGWTQFAFESPTGDVPGFLTLGFVDFSTAAPLIAGALIGSTTGVWLSGRIRRRTLEIIFAILALGVAIRLLTDL